MPEAATLHNVQSNDVPLINKIFAEDYIAISIQPLKLEPYTGQTYGRIDSISGLQICGPNLHTFSQVPNGRGGVQSHDTSERMLRGWIMPALEVCLPSSSEYPEGVCASVAEQIKATYGPGVIIAAVVNETDRRGRGGYLSISARTALGLMALEEKRKRGISQHTDRQSLAGRRVSGKNSHSTQDKLSPAQYEAIAVAGALLIGRYGSQKKSAAGAASA